MNPFEKMIYAVILAVVGWLSGTFFYDYMRDNRDSIQALIDLHLGK